MDTDPAISIPVSFPSSPGEGAGGPGSRDGERFVLLGVLGEGGMGQVLAYEDKRLGRRVAVKIARKDAVRNYSEVLEREARVTGSLEHPNIIPVYDMGDDPDWGTFYLMRLVQQPTLQDALTKIRSGSTEYTHGRLLRFFIQICQAVDYAHSRGVIHCDLKPENVLLGSFGEVFVVDWGFAYRIGDESSLRGGTPGFMPPEALDRKPGEIDARTDVFGLGCILYQLLTDKRPFAQVTFDDWAAAKKSGRVVLEAPPLPSVQAPDRNVPSELEEICMRAIELDRDKRVESARELAARLDAFLEGTKALRRRTKRAEELTLEGNMLAESYLEVIGSRPERVADAASLRATVAPWESGARKVAVWDAEDRQAVLDSLAARTFQAAVAAYEHALDELHDHQDARRGLATLYWSELDRARLRRDDFNRVQFEALALEYDDGTMTEMLRRGGTVRVECAGGPASEVAVRRMASAGPRLVPAEERLRGSVPFGPAPLEAGSYLATITRPGAPAVHCPLLVHPGRDLRVALDLAALGTDPDEILVAGGPALLGGHETNPRALELVHVELEPFVVQRFPVSFREYLAFLADLYAVGGAPAERHTPRTDDGDPYWHHNGRPGIDGFSPGRLERWSDDVPTLWSFPVFGVDAESAIAFAGWRSANAGRAYRLPTEWEWEKAARGTDGRAYPWGNRFDATFCKMRESRPGLPMPEPLGAFPIDESPYGARDMAGGVAEWVTPLDGSTHVVSRGGAWSDWAVDCHVASRRTYSQGERTSRVGFRLVRSV